MICASACIRNTATTPAASSAIALGTRWLTFERRWVSVPAIRQAVAGAGYAVPEAPAGPAAAAPAALNAFNRRVLAGLGLAFGAVLFVIVVGEWLGLFQKVTELVPWPIGLAVV